MKALLSKIIERPSELSGWLLIAIVLLLMIDFFGRGLSRPVHGASELAVFAMVAVVYLGIAHTEKKRGHVRVAAVTSRLPARVRLLIDQAVYLLALLTGALVVWAVAVNAVSSFSSDEAVAGTVPLPVWPVKFVILAGCIIYWSQIQLNAIEKRRRLRSNTATFK